MSHQEFSGVKGFATRATAIKKADALIARCPEDPSHALRYLVIALENGRFAPCFLYNEATWAKLGVFPIWFAREPNILVAN